MREIRLRFVQRRLCRSVSQSKESRGADRQEGKEMVGKGRCSQRVPRRQQIGRHGQYDTSPRHNKDAAHLIKADGHQHDRDVQNRDGNVDMD
jgi:hypothetical protein